MTLNQSALLDLTEALRSADEGKLLRTLLHTILQALVDAEATEHIGAGMHEQNDTRTKVVSTTSGDLSVKIAKTRTGSFFLTLLLPRRRIDVACGGDGGLRPRRFHQEGRRPGHRDGAEAGISKSEVSRICGARRRRVQRSRPVGAGVPLRVPRRRLLQKPVSVAAIH